MDLSIKNKKGEHYCRTCKSWYVPMFPSKAEADQKGSSTAREQWLSGTCSDACWDKMFPPDPTDTDAGDFQ